MGRIVRAEESRSEIVLGRNDPEPIFCRFLNEKEHFFGIVVEGNVYSTSLCWCYRRSWRFSHENSRKIWRDLKAASIRCACAPPFFVNYVNQWLLLRLYSPLEPKEKRRARQMLYKVVHQLDFYPHDTIS